MVNHYKTKYQVEYQKTHDNYIVYVLTEMKTGTVVETECFTCDFNGKFEKHEVYSELFDDWREARVSDLEREKYSWMLELVEKQLAEAIRDYNLNDSNFEEPWKTLKHTIRSQL